MDAEGWIDVLINNAGFGLLDTVEDIPLDDVRHSELLSPRASGMFPRMTYIITEPCMSEKDASCVDVCPVDCIYEGEDQYYIHPEECIDCGACVPECPVEAIYPDDEVPEQYEAFTAKNYTYFDVPPPD